MNVPWICFIMKIYMICYVPVQIFSVWEKCCSWNIGQNALSHLDWQIDKNSLIFFVCWCKFTKVKSWLKGFWWGMVKIECGQSVLWTLKLTVSQERADGTNWLFACWYNFTKNRYGHGQKWAWSKMGVASLVMRL